MLLSKQHCSMHGMPPQPSTPSTNHSHASCCTQHACLPACRVPLLRGAWEEIIERCEAVGVDAFEINFSCPHGLPERKMGMAMGQDCEVLGEVCGWINGKATVPVWAKMTPNITDITQPALAAAQQGAQQLEVKPGQQLSTAVGS
jgi:hypothetical protein